MVHTQQDLVINILTRVVLFYILFSELMKPPTKAKLTERRVSEQPSMLGAKVSKALSSSDTGTHTTRCAQHQH